VLPEYFGILGERATDKLAKEVDGAGPQQTFSHGWRLTTMSSSSAAACPSPLPTRTASGACLVRPDARIARYDKIHLFCFAKGAEDYDELRTIVPGATLLGSTHRAAG
jgi:nitrilase